MKEMVRVFILAVVSASMLVLTSHATPATGAPAKASEVSQCSHWEDWCKMRIFGLFWCQKWHLSSTPAFPPDDGEGWRPVRIVYASGQSHGLERGWTLDDHHSQCPGF